VSQASTHYRSALEAHFEASRGHPQYDVWFQYAADTNARGRELVDRIQSLFGPVAGRRLLDIGSGYGGTCIAAARAGAREIVGLELSPVQLRLARSNLADHPGLAVTLHEVDVLDRTATASLGRFDLVTCDNVLEHVATPAGLLERIGGLLAEGGHAYVTVPNAFSLAQLRRDCHYGLFGISLLEPFDAARYAAEAAGIVGYDVSRYYRLETYLALAERVGLRAVLLNRSGDDGELSAVRAEVDAIRRTSLEAAPPSVRGVLGAQLEAHVREVEACLSALDGAAGPARARATRAFRDAYVLERWELGLWRPGPAEALAQQVRDRVGRVATRVLGRRATSWLRGR